MRDELMRILSWAVLSTGIAGGGAAGTTEPAFTPVQPADFSVPGSLSNSWADFDRDGDLDLAVSIKSGEIRLYRNDRGNFANIGPAVGLPVSGAEMRGLSWGDYDGDGWFDLYAGATKATEANLLFRNETGRRFVAQDLDPVAPGRSARQSSWVDYDNDGDLDLFASDRAGPNGLFRQDAGRFVRVGAAQAGDDPRPTVGACWLDYDRDGDLDLFLANQAGATDALWRNDGDRFVDVAPALGMDRPGRPTEDGSVGCAVGDYDNDGELDLFVTSYGVNILYRNKGDGRFEDVAPRLGLAEDNHAVGAAWGDFDNDGWLDLFVTAYTGKSGQQQPANRLYRNLGGEGFANILTPDSMLNVADHGVQWIDYDRDGALDLSVTRGYTDTGGHFLFHNDLGKAAARRGLAVRVLDKAGRFTRMGAEVRLYDAAGKILATRQVSTGGGYNAQGTQPLHFGLASTAPITVEVTFMSAAGRKTSRNIAIRPQHYAGTELKVRER
ncbi:CRTAC1 family protein [Sphingopyxis sp. OPL5]|uniref:CRTAC1 family protein n=1 Tax=Sphingopyxis sp. OPL5 TaxID=2486273 RepID=UPI00164DA402|nr:CRTAC1 family protein [Sphingopyxis sp. OPL5]QNO25600.1 CRTAC1 family protein [Sphingopyxis sp. OPL5]